MRFTLICHDKPSSLDVRLATRTQHLAYLQTYAKHIVEAGPMLDHENRPCGSLLVIDVEDRAAAEGFADSDPYFKAGLFESVMIRRYRTVFREGGLVE